MINQKIENILNLALDIPEETRDRSQQLNIGYNPYNQEWEVIIKYTGSLERVRNIASSVSELLNGFAVITGSKEQIETLSTLEEVEYIEKPKRLYFQVLEGKRVSCINEVQDIRFSLFGQDVLIGIIDSGIDYTLEEFKNADGTTRIAALWDQSLETIGEERMPANYDRGVEFSREDINRALELGNSLRTRDISGHGTAVAGIAAGGGNRYRGVAPKSELLIVKMGNARREGFPRTTELMMGIDYVIRKAQEIRKPVAINISFGNTYGPHDGSGLLERYIESVSNVWRSVICIGTGNEGNSAGHVSGKLEESEEMVIELAVQRNSPSLNVQIWKGYFDEVDISLIAPSGVRVGPIQEVLGSQQYDVGNTQILLYYGEPSPFSVDQEIYIDFLPSEIYVDSGIWKIVLTPRRIVNGEFAIWLPSESALNEGTGFLFPSEERTLTIPSTSYGTIGVGAYDARTMTYADFSGRGPAGPGRRAKPDLAAPGVNVIVLAPGGTFAEVSGTSFATPFVTGAAALLMEWGIVKGNDPFLYGEKVKAYLQRGARPFAGEEEYPNSRVGYGALCVENSIP